MGIVIIAAAFACVVGWHFSRAQTAHRGIPARRGQLREYRGVRAHHVIWIAGLAGILMLIFIAFAVH